MKHRSESAEYVLGRVTVRLTQFSCPSTICYPVPQLNRTRLSVVLEEVGGIAQGGIDSVAATSGPHVRREVAVLPPGARAYMFSERISVLRVVSLFFDWCDLPSITGVAGGFAREPWLQIARHDSDVYQLARLLVVALECGDPSESYAKALVSAMLLRVAAAASTNASSAGLTRAQLRAVQRTLERAAVRRPDIAQLAASLGLSQSHFYRAFKRSTGLPPYRWHLQTRIQRAQALLQDPAASIADVAIATGFADQSHLTRVFKDLVGCTPHAWRRALATRRHH